MALSRVFSVAVTTGIVAASTLTIALPAAATGPGYEDWANEAQAAADAADATFIDARWDDVVAQADAFDAALALLRQARDDAESHAFAAEAAASAANVVYDEAIAARDGARDAVDDARDSLDDARDAQDAARAALDAAKAALKASPAAIAAAQADVDATQSAADQANSESDDAVAAHDDAVAAYGATVASVIGLPSWWTAINSRPVHVSDISASIADANATLATREAAAAAADVAYKSASGIAKIAAGLTLVAANGARDLAQTRVNVLNQAFTAVGGPARKQAVEDTTAAVVDTATARDEAHSAASAAVAALAVLEDAVPGLEADVTAAQAAFDAAQANLEAKRDALNGARVALDEARIALAAATTAAAAAASELDSANAHLAAIDALLDSLAGAVESIADRRADLADLESVKRTVVWSLGADNVTPRVGDTVTLNFTVPNSELFELSDAAVRIVSPLGITPTCDIVDGVVAAGATIACSATYVPTAADAAAGRVVFEVELTGYIPLGPGNPRARAVTQTLITSTQSITVPVAAAVPAEAPAADGDDELASTGADLTPGAVALTLVLAGGALLVARRRFAHNG